MTVSITLGTRGLSRTAQERRRELARMRRAALQVSAPEARDQLAMHRWTVETADGPRIVLIDDAVYQVLKLDDKSLAERTLSAYGASMPVVPLSTVKPSTLDRYTSDDDVLDRRRWVHSHVCNTDGCAGGTLHFPALGERRNARTWTAADGATIEGVKLAWLQNRAGVEATRALWRAKRRATTVKVEDAKAARKAGRRAQSRQRQLDALMAERAALTAAAVARGELTND